MGRGRGLTLVEAVVVLAVLALVIVILIPTASHGHHTSRQMQNGTQTRWIEQGFIIYSQGNNSYFPGLTDIGKLAPPLIQVPGAKYGAAQSIPSLSIALLLEGKYITPEWLVSPQDQTEKVKAITALMIPGFVTSAHYSYALSRVIDPEKDAGRRSEWRDNTNTSAVVVSDRALNRGAEVHPGAGAAAEVQRSIWTTVDGDWRGNVTFGDNSTQFLTTSTLLSTRYGHYNLVPDATTTNKNDNLFTTNGPDDAFQYRD